MLAHHISPGSIQSHSNNPKTPPRHLPDTLQTPQIQHIFYQSNSTRSQETSSSRLVHWVFINCLHIIPPRQYPESLRQPPDTSQTPSRHPTDTPNTAHFLPIQGNKETRNQLISLLGVYQFLAYYTPQTVFRVTLTPRDIPDTFQTPQILQMFTNPRQLGDKKPANID